MDLFPPHIYFKVVAKSHEPRPGCVDAMVFAYILGIGDFSFSQSGCSMGFSDGRSILSLVQQILQGTAAYVSLPPIEVVPLFLQGQVFLIALDNRRLACFVIAQVMLGNRRQVIVPVRFVCSNELRGHRLRRFHRTAMFGIRRRIKMRGHLPLVVSIHGRRPFLNYTVNHPYHRRQSVRASVRRQSL